MSQLRKALIIQEMHSQQLYLSRDGRLFHELSLNELETERVRVPELMELGGVAN
ncbi:hypothetical protein JCM19037_4145 [Geomicrobium sp. JCM 19037]|uniref:hypothetical protein n=1 Tax=Geomicrobium sp. JCM 19037 TaxID=1460634 RepID=UPI00045F252D|nr:hypothetical protein [Geomicrobium sp. JCM 19037]GAK05632.1 hypothetical protein JCM19037_4145 [Geomicrobium sp. JCM 19037]